jgi:hypothetical protein
MASALQNLPSDIVCLNGYPWDSDKEALLTAAGVRFPYAYYAPTNLDTDPDEPATQDGSEPSAPSTAPCADAADAKLFDAGFACVQQNCSTIPGSVEGRIVSSSCVQANCTSELLGLLSSADPRKSCYVCAVQTGFQHSIDYTRDACAHNPRAIRGYDGQNPQLLLSRFPLEKQVTYVFPSSWVTLVALKATAKLPGGAAVDVYCTGLGSVRDGLTVPYTGDYGRGEVDKGGWANEQRWQGEKLVSFVQRTTGAGKAVVLGNFQSSRAEGDNLEFGAPETLDYLASQWQPAAAAGYKPTCTVCADNPLAPVGSSYELVHGYVKNIAPSAIQSTQRTFMEPVEFAPDAGNPPPGPMSGEYGLRNVISFTAR